MKGSLNNLSATCVLLIALVGLPKTQAMYNNLCRLFPDGTKIGDPRSCDSYITCTNSTEVSTKCPNNQIFSVDSKKCVSSKTGCTDPCAPDIDGYWVADPKSCSGYYFCTNGTGVIGHCSADQHFSEDKQECFFSETSKCKGDSYCQVVPNGINFRDETNCEKYKLCQRGKLKTKNCPKGQWFDRELGSCAAKALVKNCDILPPKLCMNGRKIEKNKYVKDHMTCTGYYYCKDLGKVVDENPEWHKCGNGLFFNYKSQSCSEPLTVDCDDDRCDGRGDLFVNSDKDCQHYLVCKDGMTVAERKCADETFFDEKRQGCTSDVIEYSICS